jgi:hypothetical protein
MNLDLSAQNDSFIENMMTRKVLTCEDVTLNAMSLLPGLHRKSDTKLIDEILLYWRRTCGVTEPYLSFKALYDIEHCFFLELPSLPSQMEEYRRVVMKRNSPASRQSTTRYVHDSFYSFIKSWSQHLSEQDVGRKPVERFLLLFYANPSDSLVKALEHDKDHYSGLHDAYIKNKHPNVYQSRAIVNLYAGTWVPTGALALVGKHPFIGFRIGFARDRMRYFIDLNFKFLKSANDYYVPKGDSLYRTNHFFGGYVGAGISYEIFRNSSHCLDLQVSVGYDGFDAIAVKDGDSKPVVSKSLGSLNVNGGVGYKFYFGEYTTIEHCGLDIRYNYLNYRNRGGTPLTGGALMVGLVLGFNNL